MLRIITRTHFKFLLAHRINANNLTEYLATVDSEYRWRSPVLTFPPCLQRWQAFLHILCPFAALWYELLAGNVFSKAGGGIANGNLLVPTSWSFSWF